MDSLVCDISPLVPMLVLMPTWMQVLVQIEFVPEPAGRKALQYCGFQVV
ncbi:hypothetical protein [Leptolyngbya sp. FACHB-671]|nr:hypothetical protein [Leptolyngbya sp. FACHB-671]